MADRCGHPGALTGGVCHLNFLASAAISAPERRSSWRRSIERRPNPRTFRTLRFATSWSGSTNFVLSLNWFSKKGHTCHSEEFVQARSIGLVLFLFGGYLLIKWHVLNKILLSTDNLGLIEMCPSRHQLHVRRNGVNTIFCAIGLSCMPEHSTMRF